MVPPSIISRSLAVLSSTLAAAFILSGSAKADGLLFDFGADATPTDTSSTGEPAFWNNVTSAGTTDDGLVPNLLKTDGEFTDVSIQMIARFNGSNANGTTGDSAYPVTATRDSLFGNTELFGQLENIFPRFKLTGLAAGETYTITFYASRTGVGDNRETRYTVTGATEGTYDLNAANNVTESVTAENVAPDVSGEITIGLTPGPNNNNANHFTYLGVLEIEPSSGGKMLVDFGAGDSTTDYVEPPIGPSWNNITASLATTDGALIPNLVSTNGTVTDMNLSIVSRFNASNGNGSTAATVFPVTATQDSLFGNTTAFNGISDVFPEFKLTGLDPAFEYTFTFYGSRTGVNDNRETRYTATGANSAFADLNTANNVDETVTVAKIQPTESGEITVALAPGLNNNNGNRFTYLGVMKVDSEPIRTPRILLDFGSAVRTTQTDPNNTWNNVTPEIGTSDTGVLENMLTTGGIATPYDLQMVARFNGVNENGTEFSTLFPLDATRDSFYGNTEPFNNQENIFPVFKLTGLDPATAYDLLFYASRMGVGDIRETRYTVTGASETIVDFNVSNNEFEVATAADVLPDSNGEITVALTPGPNNDNGNHFTYLGVMQIDWEGELATEPVTLSEPEFADGVFSFTLSGTAGETYQIRRTQDFETWETAETVTLTGASVEVQIPQTEDYYFYQAVAE